MLSSVILFFAIYTLFLGLIVGVGFLLQLSKERKSTQKKGIDIGHLTVLIPFRNEAHRLELLLNSLNELTAYPKELVFIDDHSTDNGAQLIKSVLKGINFRIISLPENVFGKKRALRYGTEQTNSEYILTIDADVVLPATYFEELSQLYPADMYVLPAIMKPKRWLEHFYEVDLVLVTAANAGLAGLVRPIMASGANLLYKRSTFNAVDNIDSHIHAASGDDTYLLRDFRNHGADIRLVSNANLAVTTETPQSFREFIDQRLRWIGKTKDLKDHLSTTLAIMQAALTLLFFGLLILALIHLKWKMVLVLFVLKSTVDLLLFLPYFNRINRLSSWWVIPFYELFFPMYTLTLVVLLPFYKPRWKGRVIYGKEY